MLDNKQTFNAWYAISIRGENLDFKHRKSVTEIKIEEDVDAFDTCTITISDPDMEYISDDLYIEDVPMSIDIGFHNGTPYKVNFYGYIASIDLNFPEEGIPTMELYCIDKSHLMNRVKNSRTWENCTNADVVKYFADNYGFKCYIEQGYTFKLEESISQSDQTDIEFLRNLANNEIQPFVCKVVGDTLYYVKKGLLSTPVRSLSYKKYPYEIKSFRPQINRETKEIEVKYSNYTSNKTIDLGLANDMITSREQQGYPVSTSDVPFGSVAYTEPQKEQGENSESQEEADKQMIKLEMNTLTGDVELRTFPNLLLFKPFQTVIIDGVGKYLSGLYFISKVSRTLNSDGFSQSISVLKNGFGDSLKLPDSQLNLRSIDTDPLSVEVESSISQGSSVKIVDWNAVWSKECDGEIVPAWVKTETLEVQDKDGDLCLLMPINKWINVKYLKSN